MIHKIERLRSIGRFRDYTATGNVAFNKLTLIYADNGSGKTTVTSVFRSLTEGDVRLITNRISTAAVLPQAAQIIQRVAGTDTFHTYRAIGWSNPFPNIEIFDTHFVNQNIYSGFEFTDNHKKQLYQFVIGAQGVAIQQQVEQNKLNKTASRQLQDTLELQLVQQVGNGLTVDMVSDFLALGTAPADIDQRITAANTSLVNARANAVIQMLRPLGQLALITSGINFDEILADLKLTSQTIQDAALQKVFSDHCNDLKHNAIASPENWIGAGFNYMKVKSAGAAPTLQCPFCQQSIDTDLDIFKAYTQQFNEEFNQLVKRLQGHIQTVERFNLEAVIQGLTHVQQDNITTVGSWAAHLPTTAIPPSQIVFANEVALRADLQIFTASIHQKLQNPSVIGNDTAATAFQISLQEVNSNITLYNVEAANYNAAIIAFKGGIQTITQASVTLETLIRFKNRNSIAIASVCTQLIAARLRLRQLTTAYPVLLQQQEAAAAAFFTRYRDRINHYLGPVFRTQFRIDNVGHVSPQGRAMQSRIGYRLTIDGEAISFDHTQPHNAKDCLSDGDKSTLALAFFLSKLDIDPGKADKVIIFDDPLSSFDRNRRLNTVRLLHELLPIVKQIVIFSHNEFFLFDIGKSVASSDKKALRITPNFLNNSSSIEPLSLESLAENDYFKHVQELEDFLTSADVTKKDYVLGLMRNVLEAHIRFKFYRQTVALAPNNRTLGTLITTIDAGGVIFRDNANRPNVLATLRLINGISCKPHHGEPMPNYATLGTDPNIITVTELAAFVQDTLDLIDNRL